MKIGLLKQGWMTTSGSSLLRMMQNSNTPVLDLIVREAIQNSLDAALSDAKNVKVALDSGIFESSRLVNLFSDTKVDFSMIKNTMCNFLSISDSNTCGLTGKLNGIFDNCDVNQNLGKLVFQIMKPQENEGAGGSWGIGKTVYYRLGVGLVIYYSRVKLEDGAYQNRLVAGLVEDEHKKNGLLHNYDNNLGVAFFGENEYDGNMNLRAIVDDQYIEGVLDVFGLKMYENDETGTRIIIPYVDISKAVNSNKSDDTVINWWEDDILDFLKVSVLRWYFPRLSSKYPYGAKLIAMINGEPVYPDKDTEIFGKYMELYNSVFQDAVPSWAKKVEITRSRNMQDEILGWFVYGKVIDKELGNNLPNVSYYVGGEPANSEYNTPTVCVCRKPGMIINYQNDWKAKSALGETIIGIFVLNSKNKISNPVEINLDEYIRRGEKSDHAVWVDYSINSNARQINIVKGIYNQIKEILENEFGELQRVSGAGELNTILAHKYGKKFLPDEKFGKHHDRSNDKKGGNNKTTVRVKNGNKIYIESYEFKSGLLRIGFEIELKTQIRAITLECVINTVNKHYKAMDWEKTGLAFPVSIEKGQIRRKEYGGKTITERGSLIGHNDTYNGYLLSYIFDSKGNKVGLHITATDAVKFEPVKYEINFHINTTDKIAQMSFDCNIEDE